MESDESHVGGNNGDQRQTVLLFKKKIGIMRKARFLSLPATLPQCTLCWREERNQHLLFILPELLDSKDVKFISVNVR
jgi:hypothetical protein